MEKKTRTIFYSMLILIAILGASTTFLAAKNFKNRDRVNLLLSPTPSGMPSMAATPTANQSAAVKRAATATEKPSRPADTYIIQKGETLFTIAQSQGTTQTDLAEANGISDANKIQAGQVLVMPKGGEVGFIVEGARAEALQKDVDQGKLSFRLKPDETARSDAPAIYGLTVSDQFILKNRDDNQGTAEVEASMENRKFLIKLSQPATRGPKGIWAISSIKPLP